MGLKEGLDTQPSSEGQTCTHLIADSLPGQAKFILGHFEWKASKGVAVHTSMASIFP